MNIVSILLANKLTIVLSKTEVSSGHHHTGATARARYLQRIGLAAIQTNQPKLYERTHPLTAVMAWDTRLCEILNPE